MRKTEIFTLGEHTFEMTSLGALVGRQLWLKLQKVLVPALAGLSAATDQEDQFRQVLSAAVEAVTPELWAELCDAFAGATREVLDGGAKKPPLAGSLFDFAFDGHYDLLVEFVAKGIRLNGLVSFLPETLGRVLSE